MSNQNQKSETLSTSPSPPSHARVVIIGGGAVGCSIAWHLGQLGWSDTVLLEKNELTSGSTWHAAGNCPNFVGSWTVMKMQHYSTELYRKLGELADYPMNYHVTGSIRLAHTRQRMEEFAHVTTMAKQMGFSLEMMSPADMQNAYPFLETHDLEGGLWDTYDGDIDPAQLTQAFAAGARAKGVKIIRFCPVTDVKRVNDSWQIHTNNGVITAEYVVNAAGYRAGEIGRMFGRDIPCISLAHQYLITEPIAALTERDTKLPLLRDPDSSYYLRQEKDGLLLGPYEKGCRAHWIDESDPMPDDFSFQLYPDDLDRLEWYIEDACARVPILGSSGITRVVNGPIPYTPDGLPLAGPMPGCPNAFEACVFTFGIVQAGGAGKIISEWITQGETETDSWAVDPRRFTDHVDFAYSKAKALETYSHEYAIHFPYIQWPAGRPAGSPEKIGPLHDTHIANGAVMGAYGGWERADYFPPKGYIEAQVDSYQRPRFFDIVGDECRHIRDHVGILDLPGFSRYSLSGAGAADVLNRLITNKLPAIGRIGLGYIASAKGKILSEISISRFSEDRFWLIFGAGAYWHDRDLLVHSIEKYKNDEKNLDNENIELKDETRDYATLLVSGPSARDLLSAISDADFSTKAFGWLTHQFIQISGCYVVAVRVSFTGELGWELHMQSGDSGPIYQALIEAGKAYNLKPFGMLALESMRLEKGYRSWKSDLTSDYNMFDAGLGKWVHFSKDDFQGRDALESLKTAPKRQLVTLTLETDINENPQDLGEAISLSSVFSDSKGTQIAGLVLSAGYGHRTEKSIAFAILESNEDASIGRKLTIQIVGKNRPAIIAAPGAIYDAGNALLKS